ncbi:MAG: ThiF family adenylyltransferase [Chloroflexi bacterium]|nr:ThiF family adenylyltransferase [Chloroflexota bacterium]
MYLVLPHDVLASWNTEPSAELAGGGEPKAWGAVFGVWRDDGDCLQAALPTAPGALPAGIWTRQAEWLRRPAAVRRRLGRGGFVVVLGAGTDDAPSAFRPLADAWEPVELDVVRPVADYHRRHQGLFDVGYLRDKTVTIVGLGTGGGLVADQLARCGVGGFRLVDFDRLKTHNIARHVCDLSDLGRLKTAAVADRLRRISPFVQVEEVECNVLDDSARLAAAIVGADLVIAATDSEASKSLINRLCWENGVPAIYGAAYNRAFGGDVFRSIPPEGACYACFQSGVADLFDSAPKVSEIDYAAIEDPTRFVAEPGLGMDVGFVALLLAKTALLTLLRGAESQLDDFADNYLMWGNQAMWVFDHPLQALFLDIPRQTACEVCDPAGYRIRRLGADLTPQEIEQRVAALLAGAQTDDETPSAPAEALSPARHD